MEYGLYNNQLPSLVIGFHGCDRSVAEKVINGEPFVQSDKDYDWLGEGIYFWDNNPTRAMEWAIERQRMGKISEPAIVGAVLNLGTCLDLLDSSSNAILETGYRIVQKSTAHEMMPTNVNIKGSNDLLLRYLDNAVIETVKAFIKSDGVIGNGHGYDSVRGMFTEGESVYPGAGFHKKDHIQICICNPNCIKGVFRPRKENTDYWIP